MDIHEMSECGLLDNLAARMNTSLLYMLGLVDAFHGKVGLLMQFVCAFFGNSPPVHRHPMKLDVTIIIGSFCHVLEGFSNGCPIWYRMIIKHSTHP